MTRSRSTDTKKTQKKIVFVIVDSRRGYRDRSLAPKT